MAGTGSCPARRSHVCTCVRWWQVCSTRRQNTHIRSRCNPPRPQPQGIGIRNLGEWVLLVDLPLCVVGDTLTIPLAFYEWHREEGHTDTTDPVGGRGEATTAPAPF